MPHYVIEASDYSEESDSEKGGHDVTELYRRKPPYCPTQRQRYYEAPQYYDPRYNYKANNTPPIRDTYENVSRHRNTYQQQGRPYLEQRPVPHNKNVSAVRKYPVTVNTPRYYRCGSSTLCKKPTALCLPAAAQPDPASAYRRTVTKQSGSEGDVSAKLNDLDNLLTKFDDEQFDMSSLSDITKILKPKVPASFKARLNKLNAVKVVNEDLVQISTDAAMGASSCRATSAPPSPLGSRPGPSTKCDMGVGEAKATPGQGTLDDNSALELHQSKCYIVNLIDKALSRELGTVSDEKITKKEFARMNPKKAVELVNRHSQTGRMTNQKHDAEEPIYLKQLRQLRWGHLRHIQREAKRLADLERFLDTFGETF